MNNNKSIKNFLRFLSISFVFVLIFSSGISDISLSYAEMDIDFIEEISELIQENYIEDVEDSSLEYSAINGMLSSLDPYSRYYTKEQYNFEVENNSGEFAGVGISMSIDKPTGYVLIEEVYIGMPAIKAGLRDGDLITHIDGKSTIGMNINQVALSIRGVAGEPVLFTIQRKGRKEPFKVKVIREIVKFSSVESKYLADDKIMYFNVEEFNDGVAKNLEQEYLSMLNKYSDVKGIIINLKNNPGGYVDEAVKMADIFLPVGEPIYHCMYKYKDSDSEYSKRRPIYKGKIAILINENSASASELFTGALQDAGVARVFGTKSFGKGIMQGTVEYEDGSAIELTIAEYVTGKKHKVHKIGITPDEIVVENPVLTYKNYAPMNENKIYKFGQRGLNIYAAQQRLIDLGYDVEATGIYDEKTLSAIKKFVNELNTDLSGKDIKSDLTGDEIDLTPKFLNNIDRVISERIKNPSNLAFGRAIEWINKDN